MKKLLTLYLIFPILLFSFDYQASWTKVKEFNSQRLPKSALNEVEKVYNSAKKEKNSVQFIKATLYKKNYISTLNEEGRVKAIQIVEKAIKDASSSDEKAILNSILAQMYSSYLEENYYRIHKRTAIKNSTNNNILTWSSEDFLNKIYKLYQKSLDENTKHIALDNYKEILTPSKNTQALRPDLYDFLVFRALDYFSNTSSYIHQTKDDFYFKTKDAFGDAQYFATMPFLSADSKNFIYQSTLLYQKLINYYQTNHYTKALDYVNILRLKFVKQHYQGKNAQEYYLEALNHLVKFNPNSEALIELINHAMQQGDYQKGLELVALGLKSSNLFVQLRAKDANVTIMQQRLQASVEEINLPNENILTKIEYKNIDQLFVKIFKLTTQQRSHLKEEKNPYKFIKTLNYIREINFSLPKTTDHKVHATELSLGKLDIGQYLLLLSPNQSFEKKHIFREFSISKLSYLERGKRLLIVDRKSGKPLEGIEAIFKNNKSKWSKKSDSKGFINLSKIKKSYHLLLKKGEDILDIDYNRVGQEYPHDFPDNGNRIVYFFTDRSIYRPKQTIYFKGLALSHYKKKKPKILSSQRVIVSFRDTNGQTIEKKEFNTDEFGAFHGTFTAPSSGRLGSMYLYSSLGGEKSIKVEEYKRPKFEVSFQPNKEQYALGDTIHIKGLAKAYAGNGLDGAKVNYRVERVTHYNWYCYGFMPRNTPSVQIKSGTLTTNKNGEFEIAFVAKEEKSETKNYPNYDFTIYADVTDSTGETHSNSTILHIGKINFVMNLKFERRQNVEENNTLELESQNLNGEFIPLKGTIKIYRLKPKDRLYVRRYWKQGDKKSYTKEAFEQLFPKYRYDEENQFKSEKELIKTIAFDTSKSKNISLNDLPQGYYKFILAVDGMPNKLSQTKLFNRYSNSSRKLIEPSYLWAKHSKKSYKVGEEATLTIKSSIPNAKVLLTINQYNKILEEKWIDLKQFKQEIIKLKKSYQGNIDYQLTMVQDNRPFIKKGVIVIPWNDKLHVEFMSFRDKLKPNKKEQWRVKVSGENKEKVFAQMVATIYDASLDALLPHRFHLPSLYPSSGISYREWRGKNFHPLSLSQTWTDSTQGYIQRIFPRIKWINSYQNYDRMALSSPMAVVEPVMEEDSGMGGGITPVSTYPQEQSSYDAYALPKKRNVTPKEPKVSIRKNLQETMYFKPDLTTDKDGNIIINFKTNEALTRWNFLAFVYTKDLKTAVAKKSFVTSKELMVTTNLPRFFREKDTITLVAKVVNMSEKDVNGTCELHLVDAITEQPIMAKPFVKNISIKKGASTTVAFTFNVPNVDKFSAIKHTIIAKTSTHSDAEEVIVPILSNRVFVTESKNMFVKPHQKKSFTLESLKKSNSNTISNHKLTLEFTSNPAWYAIRSLPYLMEFPHECNEQLFNRYFANAIASKIANSSPKIKEVFKKWKSKKELLSALETNKELKSVLLEETPWVLNAKSEDEQQANLGLLFDLNRLAKEQKSTYNKLIKRQSQHQDGGWAWFESPYSNWYITQYIVEGFGKLKKLGIDKTNTKALSVATHYIDMQMLKKYKKLLESVEKYGEKLEDEHLSSIVIHYLYARSFYKFKMDKETQQAHDYYFNEIKKYWVNKGLYEQGLIALTLESKGDHIRAMKIVKSLKERALVNSELGMYFKYNNGYYWNQMPIETHTLLMEVFNTVANDQESVELMKTWLLKNKQTNHWATTKATASAIYALLSDGKWLKSDKLVDVAFDTTLPNVNEKIKKAKKEAGTGYFKVSYSKFDKSMATVKVDNPNDSIAWGALYWQYFEDMDKVKKFKETPLTIDKQLFLIEQTPQGEQLSPIANQPLKVGDKVKVRIEIKVDRDMEFVMLKDSRASAFEPLNVLSQYKYQDGLGYYQSTKDSATYFFMDSLRRGTYVFEYPLVVTHRGDFSNGITTIESMYAPEFRSHSRGVRVRVE